MSAYSPRWVVHCVLPTLVGLIIAIPSLSRTDPPTPSQRASAAAGGDLTAVAALARDATRIDVADVVSVGPAPGFWAGAFEAIQTVRYHIVEPVAGTTAPVDSLAVDFLITENSPWVESNTPALRAGMFAPGARHLVMQFSSSYFAGDAAAWARTAMQVSVVVVQLASPSE